jgi:hypothetical protein
MPRSLCILTLVACLPWGGCTVEELFSADFIDVPFGAAGLKVADLDEPTIQPVMNAVNTRIRAYTDLRAQLPFESLSTPGCLSDVAQTLTSVSFVLDVSCAFEGGSGQVVVNQEDVSTAEASITRMELDYLDVLIGDLTVTGREVIVETDSEQNGSSRRTLDLMQNDTAFVYEFRLGVINDDQLAVDYRFNLPKGELPVRLILPPSSPGALGLVFLMTIDGGLQCELRNTPDATNAKGTCENGLTFGLPAT